MSLKPCGAYGPWLVLAVAFGSVLTGCGGGKDPAGGRTDEPPPNAGRAEESEVLCLEDARAALLRMAESSGEGKVRHWAPRLKTARPRSLGGGLVSISRWHISLPRKKFSLGFISRRGPKSRILEYRGVFELHHGEWRARLTDVIRS